MNFKDIFKISRAIKKAQETESKFINYIKHIPNFVRLYWRLLKDKRVAFKLKLMLIGSIIYFLSPLDFVPEILVPFFGYIDDGILIVLAFKYFIKWSPPEVVKEHILQIDEQNKMKQERKKQNSKDD